MRRTASKVSAEQAEEKYEGRVDQGTGERSKKVVPACLGDHRLKNLSRILGYRDCREKKRTRIFHRFQLRDEREKTRGREKT